MTKRLNDRSLSAKDPFEISTNIFLAARTFSFFFYEATLLPLHSTTKITTTEALDGKKYFLLLGKVKKIFQTLKTIKSLIHKKIIVPL